MEDKHSGTGTACVLYSVAENGRWWLVGGQGSTIAVITILNFLLKMSIMQENEVW